MRIAIATNERGSLEDGVALHFGRANNFLIFDTETKSFEVFENPEILGKELPPDFLNRLGIDAVIAFSLGPMAFEKFKKFGIKIYKAKEGIISKNIELLEKAKLSPLSEKDIF